jgi:hypothetical protein
MAVSDKETEKYQLEILAVDGHVGWLSKGKRKPATAKRVTVG